MTIGNAPEAHRKVKEHYEKYPYPHYSWWAYGRWSDLKHLDLRTWGGVQPLRRVWLVGCGTIQPVMFARRNPSIRLICSDLSQATLRQLRRRCWLFGCHQLEFYCEDFLEHHFDEKVDAIDAYGVIHHTQSPLESLRHLQAQLKPGGVLRLMIYSKQARAEIEKLRSTLDKTHSPEQLQGELKKNSAFESIEFESLEGIADSLFHPLVHIFSREEALALIEECGGWKILKSQHAGNHIFFLEKL